MGIFAFFSIAIYSQAMLKGSGAIYILIGSVALYSVFVLLKHSFEQMTDADYKRMLYIGWAVLLVLQVVFLLLSRNLLRYDALNVYDEAVSFFYDGGISPETNDGYFAKYANNHPITILTFVFLKIGHMIGIVAPDFHNGIYYLQWINLVAIDVALFSGFLFVKDFFKSKSLNLCYMLFVVFSPLTYVWIPYYYTNTISMPFYMLALFLLCRFLFVDRDGEKQPLTKKDICLLALAGAFAYVGFSIRATVVITLIALVMGCILGIRKIEKKYFIACFIVLFGVMVGVVSMKFLSNKYVKFDYSDSAFPVTHWVMMGTKGVGTFNKKDENFTAYFVTAEDKSNATKSLLKSRLQELKVTGTVKLAFDKMHVTFGDGTGDFTHMLSISERYDGIYRYVYGDKNHWLVWYTQSMYFASMLASIIYAVSLLIKKQFHPGGIVLINLLGAYMFYILWESGSVYSISFMPLFYIALVGGINIKNKTLEKYTSQKLGGVAIAAWCMVMAVHIIRSLQASQGNELIYQVNQYMFQTDHYQPCSSGITLQQTFASQGEFDCIAVQARNPEGKLNDSIYRIDLKNGLGEICETMFVHAAEIVDYQFVRFRLASVYGPGDYSITIAKEYGKNDMIWLYYDTGNYDAYEMGELTGFPVTNKLDLAFKVYLGEESEDYFDGLAAGKYVQEDEEEN